MRLLLSPAWKRSFLLKTDTEYSISLRTWKGLKLSRNIKLLGRPCVMLPSEAQPGQNTLFVRPLPFGKTECRCFCEKMPFNIVPFKLMQDKEIKCFSILLYLRSKFILYFISMKIDKKFNGAQFADDAEHAFRIISRKLAEGDFSGLSEVFEPNCWTELKKRLDTLKPSERRLLGAGDGDFSTFHIFDADVEIVKMGTDSEPEELLVKIVLVLQQSEHTSSFQTKVFNVTFTRTYSKAKKSPWLISALNMICVKFPTI